MRAFVADTNVLVVANGTTEQARLKCVLACVDAKVKFLCPELFEGE